MSDVATDAGDGTGDPMQDAEAWQDLDRDAQDELLDEGLARLKGDRGEGHWRHLSTRAQRETIDAIEGRDHDDLSEAEAAMQEALDDTWTAELFAAHDDVPTVPMECRELSDQEQDIMMDGFLLFDAIEQEVEEPDDIDDVGVESEFFDSIEQFEDWLFAFLADVTQDDGFDANRFRTGARLRSGTRGELLSEIFFRYQQEAERAEKFRTEQGR